MSKSYRKKLEKTLLKKLKVIAKEKKIKGYYKLNKAPLINELVKLRKQQKKMNKRFKKKKHKGSLRRGMEKVSNDVKHIIKDYTLDLFVAETREKMKSTLHSIKYYHHEEYFHRNIKYVALVTKRDYHLRKKYVCDFCGEFSEHHHDVKVHCGCSHWFKTLYYIGGNIHYKMRFMLELIDDAMMADGVDVEETFGYSCALIRRVRAIDKEKHESLEYNMKKVVGSDVHNVIEGYFLDLCLADHKEKMEKVIWRISYFYDRNKRLHRRGNADIVDYGIFANGVLHKSKLRLYICNTCHNYTNTSWCETPHYKMSRRRVVCTCDEPEDSWDWTWGDEQVQCLYENCHKKKMYKTFINIVQKNF